jgi:hypothetical protein
MSLSILRLAAAILRLAPRRAAPSTAKRSPARRRARFAVALVPAAFVFVLASAWAAAEAITPEITDTDYYLRLRMIRAATAEHPDRPLALVVGSSRMVWGFRPEVLPDEPAPGEVYWLNAAHVGSGPSHTRLTLHRLLRDGVRPAVVVIELMPTFFAKENNRFIAGHFAAAEMPLMRPYADKPLDYDYHFLSHRLSRAPDIARVTDPFAGYPTPLPRGGHPHCEATISPAERAKRTAAACGANFGPLQHMNVRPGADLALRDAIREATAHGIRVVLLRSPEGPTFRSWYKPDAQDRFDDYVARVSRETGVPVLDARLWLDEEDFYDSHHALKPGAEKFTVRFAKEMSALLK